MPNHMGGKGEVISPSHSPAHRYIAFLHFTERSALPRRTISSGLVSQMDNTGEDRSTGGSETARQSWARSAMLRAGLHFRAWIDGEFERRGQSKAEDR